MPEALPRIRRVRELLPPAVHVQVDGGIGPQNARDVREAGATLLVAATAIFHQDDLAHAYRRLAEAAG
jgi:ribulose-phosphate 3-epimerase